MQGFYDRNQLAARTDNSTRTIARWDAKRIGPPRVKIGRKWYYPIPETEAWLRAGIEVQCNAPNSDQAAS